jgi:hypothetical protein
MGSKNSWCHHIGLFLVLISTFLAGCAPKLNFTQVSPTSLPITATQPSPTITHMPTLAPPITSPMPDLSSYTFPASIDPGKRYLFYLHGKIIEDQGLPAISPDFGEYEYTAILKKLSDYDFIVISEQRFQNTDSLEYAKRVAEQITRLLEAGVPAQNITVLGASKGAGIAIDVSHLLENPEINYVLMAICAPDNVQVLIQNQVTLHGNVLSIYDFKDDLAGSCQELFSISEGKGLARHAEIVLHIGTGHGILFKPLDDWIAPAIKWALKP